MDTTAWKASRPDQELLDNIHVRLDGLERLYADVGDRWAAEDLVYRFWHHSFKAYFLQDLTVRIVTELEALRPSGTELHPWFREIVAAGTGKTFEMAHNQDWLGHAKPIVDAFFHARFMLEMAVRYGGELEEAPGLLPSGWAALLELYQIR